MSTDTRTSADVPAIAVNRDALRAFAAERACYRRELPRLVAEGQVGRFAIFKGDALLGTWATWAEANEAGLAQFGLDESFCVQKVDGQDEARFALLDAWQAAQCQQ